MNGANPPHRAAQFPLPAFFAPRATFDQFWPGGNEELIHNLRATATGSGEPLLFLWGSPESGKSHLLQAACHCAHRQGRSVSYLPMRELKPSSEILDGLEDQHLVAIDDIELGLGEPSLERALFSLYNALRERGHALLITAGRPPAELPTQLPDLRSRWAWGAVYRINPLNEENTLAALDLCARELGLELPHDVKRFLMVRCRRDLGFLRRLLAELDRASLAAQRKLTIPFIKGILEQQT